MDTSKTSPNSMPPISYQSKKGVLKEGTRIWTTNTIITMIRIRLFSNETMRGQVAIYYISVSIRQESSF